jgi:hypothetical protein
MEDGREFSAAVSQIGMQFREERSVVPGLLLARVVGYSPYIGDVTLSVNFGNTVRAEVAEDTERGSRHLFECRVAPLLPW